MWDRELFKIWKAITAKECSALFGWLTVDSFVLSQKLSRILKYGMSFIKGSISRSTSHLYLSDTPPHQYRINKSRISRHNKFLCHFLNCALNKATFYFNRWRVNPKSLADVRNECLFKVNTDLFALKKYWWANEYFIRRNYLLIK